MAVDSTFRQRTNGSAKASKLVITEEGKEVDKRLDKHETYVLCMLHSSQSPHLLYSFEFGGPWGVIAIMTGFPILMYYFWICLWFYDGKLVYPASVEDIQPFLWRMWSHIAKVSYLFECNIYFLLNSK